MREALEHLVARIDPVTPPEAAAAKIGGLVVAEIIIGVNGAVESARIIAGHEALHVAASDAVRKWKFKPFVRNGKPARVLAILDLRFPDPKADEERRQMQASRSAENECGQLLRERSARAVDVCAEALKLAEAFRAGALTVSGRRQMYGLALFNAGRLLDALSVLERAADERIATSGEDDADSADSLAIVAVLQHRLGRLSQADAVFARAIAMLERAIARLPEFVDYRDRLAFALRQYAELKRDLKQDDAARALAAKAGEVLKSKPAPRTESMRVVAGVRCLCPDPPYFSEAEVAERIRAIPASARAWLVEGEGGRAAGRSLSAVYAAATHTGPGYRMGPVGSVSWRNPAVQPPPDAWGYSLMPLQWLLVTDSADPASEVRGRHDGWPISLGWGADEKVLSAEATVGLVRFIRAEGAKASRGAAPRLMTEVQPWPIDSIHGREQAFYVLLHDPATRRSQRLHVRRSGNDWSVESIDVF